MLRQERAVLFWLTLSLLVVVLLLTYFNDPRVAALEKDTDDGYARLRGQDSSRLRLEKKNTDRHSKRLNELPLPWRAGAQLQGHHSSTTTRTQFKQDTVR